jgi:dipeptidyl aminopeptidase/acylaminoacyl peptidase
VRERGADVWYMLAPDEGHGFRRRRTRDLFYQLMVAFFEPRVSTSLRQAS